MAEYIELIESLRRHKCTAEEPQSLECEECEYYVITEDKTAFIGFRKTCTQLLMKLAADTIEELTAHVKPIVHGKNIGKDYDEVDQFVCSNCGIELQGWYRVERDEDDDEETHHEYRFNFCPNCGAKLDSEE